MTFELENETILLGSYGLFPQSLIRFGSACYSESARMGILHNSKVSFHKILQLDHQNLNPCSLDCLCLVLLTETILNN